MSSGESERERKVSPFSQGSTDGKLAREHSGPILIVFADQQELLATARAAKGLAFEI
jgi:hypothetical protein